MPALPVVHLAMPIRAVSIVTDASGRSAAAARPAEPTASAETGLQQQLYQEACRTLETISARLNELYCELFSSHHEAIARLSVEIARKVLMRTVRDGDYEMETMIKDALKNVPESSDTVVRLHPQDLANLQTLQGAGSTTFSTVAFVADPAVGQAECVVENSKGIIKLLIDDRLEQIGKALEKTG